MGLWILIMIIWEIVIDIDRKYLYLWIGNKYYTYGYSWIIVIIIWEKNAREIDFLDFVEDINYGPWLAMGFFRRPKTPKGGNQKHTMNYWRKKKRILSSNSGNYGDIH